MESSGSTPRRTGTASRPRAVIAEIEPADRPESQPLETRVFKHLNEAKASWAKAMLDSIAATTNDAWIVREARDIRGQSK